MAKEKKNVSAVIRELLKKDRNAKAADIATEASKIVGKTVNPTYVYMVRGKKSEKRRARRMARRGAALAQGGGADTIALVQAARTLLDNFGSSDKVAEFLKVLER